MAAMFSPLIAASGDSLMMISPSILTGLNFFFTFFLSKPGKFLP